MAELLASDESPSVSVPVLSTAPPSPFVLAALPENVEAMIVATPWLATPAPYCAVLPVTVSPLTVRLVPLL